jgi:hypothetical protein
VQEFSGALKGAQGNLANELPFDRRDVELDIMELGAQRRDVLAIRPAPVTGGFGGGGGDGGSIADFVGGGGAIIGPDLSQALADALKTIGQLRLALGIENVQLPIIGQFQKGTLNVPTTGLALVHAGEQITPAGVRSGSDSSGPVEVHVHIAEGMEFLRDLIRVEAVNASGEISARTGRESDFRRRSGGY